MVKRLGRPPHTDTAEPFRDEELAVLRETSQIRRTLASQLRSNEVSLDKALFEDLRATVAYIDLPLLRRLP